MLSEGTYVTLKSLSSKAPLTCIPRKPEEIAVSIEFLTCIVDGSPMNF
jgi:hypothetical protein